MLENLNYIGPEIFLSIMAMVLLMAGVCFKAKGTTKLIAAAVPFVFIIAAYILFSVNYKSDGNTIHIFDGALTFDNFAYVIKISLAFICAMVATLMVSSDLFKKKESGLFEIPVLFILCTVGMFILVSATDIMALYMGIELLSLPLYALVAINRNDEQSTEGGVKYFVLGALASGILLFGASLVYGFSGHTDISKVVEVLGNPEKATVGLTLGVVLILAGLFFKLSAAPMHMWAPDVYEASLKPVLAIIATAPKIAVAAFMIRFVSMIPESVFGQYSKIIMVVSILSMIVGAFGALIQKSFKRLIAYSSIANIGYLLIAISIGSAASFASGVMYILIYVIATIGIIGIISTSKNVDNKDSDLFDSFKGYSKTSPVYAFCLAVFLFSVAGIPPMSGFWGKFYIFKEAVANGNWVLAVVGILTSVVACFYYLKIIKIMYFDKSSSKQTAKMDMSEDSSPARFVIIICLVFTLFFMAFLQEFKLLAEIAISSIK